MTGRKPLKGPDFTGPFSHPMRDDPCPMILAKRQRDTGRFASGRDLSKPDLYHPEQNAVEGRKVVKVVCLTCGHVFVDPGDDVPQHVAEHQHIVVWMNIREIVPVDTSAPWETWADGAGVTWEDRNP